MDYSLSDAGAALARTRDLLLPGGTPGHHRPPPRAADLPWLLASTAGSAIHRLTRRYWEHPSPTLWPPPETYAGMRRLAVRIFPGFRLRRHLLWRYSLIWTKA
jgi:hypothetical protein